MLRRNFLGFLGVLPFGFSNKAKENPKNLPIVKFQDGKMTNHKELLGNKNEVLVWVKKEDSVMMQSQYNSFHEMKLVKTKNTFPKTISTTNNYFRLHRTENTELIKDNNCWRKMTFF